MSWCFYGNCMHGLWERNRHTQCLGFPRLPLSTSRTEPSSLLWESPLMVRFQISVVLRVAFCPPVPQPRPKASSSLNCYLELGSNASPPDTFFRLPCSSCLLFIQLLNRRMWLWWILMGCHSVFALIQSWGLAVVHAHNAAKFIFLWPREREGQRSLCLHLSPSASDNTSNCTQSPSSLSRSSGEPSLQLALILE